MGLLISQKACVTIGLNRKGADIVFVFGTQYLRSASQAVTATLPTPKPFGKVTDIYHHVPCDINETTLTVTLAPDQSTILRLEH